MRTHTYIFLDLYICLDIQVGIFYSVALNTLFVSKEERKFK